MTDKKAHYCRTCFIEVPKSGIKYHQTQIHELLFIPLRNIPYSETLEFGKQAYKLRKRK